MAVYADGGGQNSKTNLPLFDAGPDVRYTPFIEVSPSQAKLKGDADELWVSVKTVRLPPGAYTNWWVIFNDPTACSGGCGADDFGLSSASVLFARGGVVGDDGKTEFEAHLEEGNSPGQVLFGPGLTDAEAAEVHYVIRFHGPTNTNDEGVTLEDMITTFGGGCNNTGNEEGDGNYPCWDPQVAVFPLP